MGTSAPFTSDASCFPSYSDAKERATPACAKCGKPSSGASFDEFSEGSTVGHPLAVFRFSCGCDGKTIVVRKIWPAWRLMSEREPGVWVAVKRSDEEKEAACRQQ